MDEAWERAVDAACGGAEHDEVLSLNLDGAVKCPQGRLPAAALLEQFSQIRVLSIANVGLASLTDFPSLTHLQRLILSDNRISGGLDSLVEAGLVSLRDLDLSNNKIQTLEDLAPLAKLNLLSLDLYECPVTRVEDYRSKVFSSIKSLQYLDNLDPADNERPESDEEEEEEDDKDADDVKDSEVATPGARNRDEDEIEDGEESDEGALYNGVMNHSVEDDDVSESEDKEDEEDEDGDEGGGDAVEVHDIEETEEDEDEGGDQEDVGEGEEEADDGDEEGTELALSLEGEMDAQEDGDDENGEVGDEDVVIEDDGEEDEDDVLQAYYGSGYSIQGEDERPEPEDDDEDDERPEPEDDDEDDGGNEQGFDAPAAPSAKRKRSKDDDSNESKDERPPKH